MDLYTYTKEIRLMQAFLEYIGACLVDGDIDSLHKLGLEGIDVEKMMRIRVGDWRYFGRLPGHIIDIRIDRTRLHLWIDHIDRNVAEALSRDYLVEHDAPTDLLKRLYGIHSKECRVYRAIRGVKAHNGRPRAPTPEEAQKVYAACQALGKDDVEQLTADDWVEIHRTTGVSLRAIWTLTHEWMGPRHTYAQQAVRSR